MSSAFQLTGGPVESLKVKLTTTAPTIIAGSSLYMTGVIWFQCTEITGATPNLTVEIYDDNSGVRYYLRNAKAMTPKEEVKFIEGLTLQPNEFLRVTASAANQVDIVGISLLGGALG